MNEPDQKRVLPDTAPLPLAGVGFPFGVATQQLAAADVAIEYPSSWVYRLRSFQRLLGTSVQPPRR